MQNNKTAGLVRFSNVLRMWASYRSGLASRKRHASFEPVRLLVSAASEFLGKKRSELDSLFAESGALFSPLSDPLVVDLGAHRWLQGQREERYSDWLKWTIEQVEDSADLFSIFGIDESGVPLLKGKKSLVQCEEFVQKGHEGHSGRLDVRILFPGQLVIVIEVKLFGGGDVGKNKGYVESAEKAYPKEVPEFIFLTPSPDDNPNLEPGPHQFRLLLWSEVCMKLRRYVVKKIPGGNLTALAMILAFVGAVEQNLLGLSAISALSGKNPLLINSATLDHIRKFIERKV